MYFKCELVIVGYSYLVTNYLKNWDDITSSFKRQDYDGVVRTFSNKFEFTGVAYDLIKSEYRKNYLDSSASVVFYTRNNSWLWNERFRLTLDFSTLVDDGNTISINATDGSLASLIKSKKGAQYEYSVDAIKESNQLLYDGLTMCENVKWKVIGIPIGDTVDMELEVNARFYAEYMPISILSSEINIKNEIEINGTSQEREIKRDDIFLFKSLTDREYRLFVAISLEVPSSVALGVFLIKIDSIGNETTIHMASVGKDDSLRTLLFRVDQHLPLTKGDYLYISQYSAYNFKARINFGDISLNWESRLIPQLIDVTTPTTLLNRLLQSMNGGAPGITGEIQSGYDKRLAECVIVAAESAKGIPKAKLYSSYSKFCDWMECVFGYVPVIGDNKVIFIHRDTLFLKKTVKKISSYSDFEYSVNSSLIYSRVRVGYEKQDYESVNGRDEFRVTNEYDTGAKLTDSSLELISPYRADAYGIEFLVQKRGEDTTDDSSDNDVFFVNAHSGANGYSLIRHGYTISGVISPDTMFNVVYSPRFMIEANKRFIAASVRVLHFSSSDGNSDVIINGVKESEDIRLSNKLFTVGNLSFETSDLDIPEDFRGLVTIENQGEKYRGYIEKVGVNYGRAEAVKYSLIVEGIVSGDDTQKPICTISEEHERSDGTKKMVADVAVNSGIVVTVYAVKTETGIISSVSDVFTIPAGARSSQIERFKFLYPGFHYEYSIDIDEDDMMRYVLDIE